MVKTIWKVDGDMLFTLHTRDTPQWVWNSWWHTGATEAWHLPAATSIRNTRYENWNELTLGVHVDLEI